jgi:hypothetical protein
MGFWCAIVILMSKRPPNLTLPQTMDELNAAILAGAHAFARLVALEVESTLRRAPVVQPRLLGVPEVAIILGRTEGAVRQLLHSGALKNASPDGRVQVDVRDLDPWIDKNKK